MEVVCGSSVLVVVYCCSEDQGEDLQLRHPMLRGENRQDDGRRLGRKVLIAKAYKDQRTLKKSTEHSNKTTKS